MSGGFGRKGGGVGAPVPRTFGGAVTTSRYAAPRAAASVVDPEDGLSPAARAFIVAERGRGAERVPVDDPMASAAASAMRLAPPKSKSDRSLMMAYVLWWFSGPIGAHRFYLGAHRSGLAMIGLFFGGLLVMLATPLPGVTMICACIGWTLVDAFLIPGLMRQYKASHRPADLAHVFA